MAYKSVQQSELMAHEFASVEGALHHLDEKALKEAMPSGMKLEAFKDQLRQGHMVLLTDTPAVPLLVQESGGLGQRTWAVNPKAQSLVTPTAQKALLARTQMRGRASGVSQNLPPPPPLHYVPEPALPDSTEEAPSLKYEYSVEVAGSQASFRKNIGARFVLAKTAEEGMLGRWMDSQTEHGTLYTVLTAFNEPKNLLAHVPNIPMGISPKHPVKVRALGSRTAYEAFIPVSPTVQVRERLGLPTQGYYYHFHRHALVQEYRIIGDDNWGYYATASQPHQLNTERGYNTDQTAILVYWKLGGKVCDNQHLVYLPRPITLEELSNVNEDWLLTHGVKLDINQLLATQSHAIAERASTDEQSPSR